VHGLAGLDAQVVLPLLELEQAGGDLPPLSLMLGITSGGVPLVVDMLRPETGHMFAVGPGGSGKSTLLRTAMASICLHASPSQVGLLAIDLSGRQLSVLEAIPHRLAAPAVEVDEACQLLAWFEREVQDRLERGIHSPALILIIDDLDWVTDPDQAQSLEGLRTIVRTGAEAGVHILAGGSFTPGFLGSPGADGFLLAAASGEWSRSSGDFVFTAANWQASAQIAFLSARDLNRLVVRLRGCAEGPRSLSRAPVVREPIALEVVE